MIKLLTNHRMKRQVIEALASIRREWEGEGDRAGAWPEPAGAGRRGADPRAVRDLQLAHGRPAVAAARERAAHAASLGVDARSAGRAVGG